MSITFVQAACAAIVALLLLFGAYRGGFLARLGMSRSGPQIGLADLDGFLRGKFVSAEILLFDSREWCVKLRESGGMIVYRSFEVEDSLVEMIEVSVAERSGKLTLSFQNGKFTRFCGNRAMLVPAHEKDGLKERAHDLLRRVRMATSTTHA